MPRPTTQPTKARKVTPSLDAFHRYLAETKSPRTVAGYARDLRLFARWFEQTNKEPLTPQALTPTDLREYRQRLLNVEKARPATINRRLAAIRAYVDWARQAELIDTNPANGVKGVAEQKAAPKWLDKKERHGLLREVARDLNAAQTEPARWQAIRDQAIVIMLLNTGLRISELCALDMNDVEIGERKGVVHVRAGKGEKARGVPLNKTARDSLRAWLKVRRRADDEHKDDVVKSVFVGQRGDPLQPRAVQRLLADLGHRARVEVTPHVLRHSFAKSLIDAGVSIDQVATLLGHSNLNTTRLYTTPGAKDLERAVEALEG